MVRIKHNDNRGRGNRTANDEVVDYILNGWSSNDNSILTTNINSTSQAIPLEIRDNFVEDGNNTLVWTIDEGSNLGFSQEAYVFSENDDTNPDIKIGTPANPPITLKAGSSIKSAVILIEDNVESSDNRDDYTLEPIKGTLNSDTLFGTDKGDAIYGYAGNDTLEGLEGSDSLYGWEGHDILYGGDSFDNLYGMSGDDRLYGEADNDVLDGGEGNDVLDGGEGDDQLFSWIGNDTLYGGSEQDILFGEAGNDVLNGGADNDTLYGGKGRDILDGGTGADVLDGGTEGTDNDIYVVDDPGDTILELPQTGIETVRASITWDLGISYNPTPFEQTKTFEQNPLSGLDHLVLTGSDAINGTGNYLDNTITGNSANNTLNGNGANDRLIGGGGADTLIGGNGIDRLIGGNGNDTLTGGTNADRFVFGSLTEKIDTITDFNSAEGDRIQISKSGFGAASTNQFTYNANTGALFFKGEQFALLQPNLSFVAANDIILS
jgi:serralysin